MLGEDKLELQAIERRRALDENLDAWRALAGDFLVMHKEITGIAVARQKDIADKCAHFVFAGGNFFSIPSPYEKPLYAAYEALRQRFFALRDIKNHASEADAAGAQAMEMAGGLQNDSRTFKSYLAKAQSLVGWLGTIAR